MLIFFNENIFAKFIYKTFPICDAVSHKLSPKTFRIRKYGKQKRAAIFIAALIFRL